MSRVTYDTLSDHVIGDKFLFPGVGYQEFALVFIFLEEGC